MSHLIRLTLVVLGVFCIFTSFTRGSPVSPWIFLAGSTLLTSVAVHFFLKSVTYSHESADQEEFIPRTNRVPRARYGSSARNTSGFVITDYDSDFFGSGSGVTPAVAVNTLVTTSSSGVPDSECVDNQDGDLQQGACKPEQAVTPAAEVSQSDGDGVVKTETFQTEVAQKAQADSASYADTSIASSCAVSD